MRRLVRDRLGVAEVEFALLVPGLMLFLVFAGDMVQLGRGHLRVQSAANQLSQVVSQCRTVTAGDETELFSLAKRLLGPFAADGKWAVVITAMVRDADGKDLNWNMRQVPGGFSITSQGAARPDGLILERNQAVFRTEIFASIPSTFFSRSVPLVGERFGLGARSGGFDSASAAVVHMTRAPNANGLTEKKAGGRDCMT